MGKSRIKWKSQNVTVTAAMGVTTLEVRADLDTSYAKVTGIGVFIVKRTATDNIRIGFRDDQVQHQDLVHISNNESTTAVSPNDRYKKVDIRAGGNVVTIMVQTLVAVTTDYSFDVVFQLED